MIRRMILVLLVIMGIGCEHNNLSFYYIGDATRAEKAEREINIWVDKGFGEGDRVAIEEAIGQWNYALNGYVILRVVSYDFDMEIEVLKRVERGDGWLIMKIDGKNGMVYDPPGGMTLAFVNKLDGRGNKMYVIRERVGNEWMLGLFLHEMGHLLGARHDEGTLMAAYYNVGTYRCVDRETMEQVAEAQKLNIESLKYCVW